MSFDVCGQSTLWNESKQIDFFIIIIIIIIIIIVIYWGFFSSSFIYLSGSLFFSPSFPETVSYDLVMLVS